jgi:hypothetical protein
MDKNEWQHIAIGRNIFTIANTKAVDSKLIATGIWQMPSVIQKKSQRWRVHATIHFHIANGHEIKTQGSNFENVKMF